MSLLANVVIGNLNNTGAQPSGIDYDPADGDVYVADYGSNNVSIISGSSNQLLASPQSGDDPLSVTYDPLDGDMYASNYGITSDLSVYNGTGYVTAVKVGAHPRSSVYDPSNHYLYVMVTGTDNVSLVSGFSVVGKIQVGSDPEFAALDSSNGYLYVTNLLSDTVSVISGTYVVTTIRVGANPLGVAYDPANDYVYVENSGGSNVSVIDGTILLGNVTTGTLPEFAAYDAADGYEYVTNAGSGTVSVLNGTAVVANVSVGVGARSVTYDPANGYVYVGDQSSSNISVLNGTHELALVDGGSGAYDGVYDPANGDVYVTEFDSANVSVVGNVSSPWYVTFDESGLPAGAAWGVSVEATDLLSNTTSVAAFEPNGTYTFSVPPISGYSSSGGSFRIASDDPVVDIDFRADYPVYFNETGLPSGTFWTVELAGVSESATVPSIAFSEPSATYHYSITPVPGFSATWTGLVTVAGGPATVLVTFVLVQYNVTFESYGLPSGNLWTVTFRSTSQSATTNVASFISPNGTFDYGVTPPPDYGVNRTGVVQVNGTSVLVAVDFTLVQYTVTFRESGLPAHTNWSVTFGGVAYVTNSTAVVLHEPNGTYRYTVGSVPGFSVGSSGTTTLDGRNVTTDVRYSAIVVVPTYAVQFTERGLPDGWIWGVTIWGSGGSSPIGDSGPRSNGTELALQLPNGTYEVVVVPPAGYRAEGPSGLTVAGEPATVAINFVPFDFEIEFEESGLPSGAVWTVVLSGPNGSIGLGPHGSVPIVNLTAYSSSSTLDVPEPNGTYALRAIGPNGYSVATGEEIVVNGSDPAPIALVFASTSPSGLSASLVTLAGGAAGAAFVVAALAVVLRRRPGRGPSGEPPSEEAPTEEGGEPFDRADLDSSTVLSEGDAPPGPPLE